MPLRGSLHPYKSRGLRLEPKATEEDLKIQFMKSAGLTCDLTKRGIEMASMFFKPRILLSVIIALDDPLCPNTSGGWHSKAVPRTPKFPPRTASGTTVTSCAMFSACPGISFFISFIENRLRSRGPVTHSNPKCAREPRVSTCIFELASSNHEPSCIICCLEGTVFP